MEQAHSGRMLCGGISLYMDPVFGQWTTVITFSRAAGILLVLGTSVSLDTDDDIDDDEEELSSDVIGDADNISVSNSISARNRLYRVTRIPVRSSG